MLTKIIIFNPFLRGLGAQFVPACACEHSLHILKSAKVIEVILFTALWHVNQGRIYVGVEGARAPQIHLFPPYSKASWKNVGLYGARIFSVLENG